MPRKAKNVLFTEEVNRLAKTHGIYFTMVASADMGEGTGRIVFQEQNTETIDAATFVPMMFMEEKIHDAHYSAIIEAIMSGMGMDMVEAVKHIESLRADFQKRFNQENP